MEKVNYQAEKIESALKVIKSECERLEELTTIRTGKIEKVELVHGAFGKGYTNVSGYAKKNCLGESNFETTAKTARIKTEEMFAVAKETHKNNIPALESNKKLADSVVLMFQNMGIGSTYSVYERKTNRHRNKEWIKHKSGFTSDISRCMITDDGFDQIERAYKQKLIDIDKFLSNMRAKKQEDDREIAKKEEKNKLLRLQMFLAVKYKMGADSLADDILNHFKDLDKYLDLGMAMVETRGDWSEGYYRVESALERFPVESPEDQLMFDNIQKTASDAEWGHDGRCFRDCTWNYDKVLEFCKKEILKDYQELSEMME